MPPPTSHARTASGTFISEQLIQDSFHSYLKSSLTQAKLERLLDAEVLSSAEADLMITGPALCLYFAALRCTTNPPSVPLPRTIKGSSSSTPTSSIPLDLSPENCPPSFVSFLKTWSANVYPIQSLPPEHQHNLARIICNLPPLIDSPDNVLPDELYAIAAELRAVAIEISQRRSFQERYGEALQAALDAGSSTSSSLGSSSSSGATPAGATTSSSAPLNPQKATFVPPPAYDAAPPSSPTPATVIAHSDPSKPISSSPPNLPVLPQRPTTSIPMSSGVRPTTLLPSTTGSSNAHALASSSASKSESLTSPTLPAVTLIRETLYAALADVISSTPELQSLFKANNAKAYWAATSLAVLQISRECLIKESSTIGVLNTSLPSSLVSAESISSRGSSDPSHHQRHSHSHSHSHPHPHHHHHHHHHHDSASSHSHSRSNSRHSSSTHSSIHSHPSSPTPDHHHHHLSEAHNTDLLASQYSIRGITSHKLPLASCPPEFKPFMKEIILIGIEAGKIEDADTEELVKRLSESSKEEAWEPRLDRVRKILIGGLSNNGDYDTGNATSRACGEEGGRIRRKSVQNSTLAFANRINALSLGMTSLRGFKERQSEVFTVLMGVANSGGEKSKVKRKSG